MDWTEFLPRLKHHFQDSIVSLELLSDLQLCPIPAQVLRLLQSNQNASWRSWLYSQYRSYGIHIYDLAVGNKKYFIPLIEANAIPLEDGSNQFGIPDPDDVARLLPPHASSLRLIIFPQTRFSFIEDDVSEFLEQCGQL